MFGIFIRFLIVSGIVGGYGYMMFNLIGMKFGYVVSPFLYFLSSLGLYFILGVLNRVVVANEEENGSEVGG